MSALADVPPRISARHRRWVSSGRGGARTTTILVGNLALSIGPDAARRLPRNTPLAQFATVHPAYLSRRAHHIRQRVALKSP
jgi:hypothetical protein